MVIEVVFNNEIQMYLFLNQFIFSRRKQYVGTLLNKCLI